MQLSKTSSPPMRLSKARCHTPSSSPVTSCSGIRTTPPASGITTMANPLPKPLMAPRSSSQVRGGWNPKKDTANGGGHYTIKNASGAIRAQGSWRVTDFSSFEYFSGWWGLGDDFKEKGWQGPPGSASFSGFLTLKVNLAGQGNGTLVAWCLMDVALKRHPHVVNPDGHVSDGISLTGGKFNFKNFKENERGGPPYDGLMFYSTDPASSWGYVLTPDGHTVPKKSAAR